MQPPGPALPGPVIEPGVAMKSASLRTLAGALLGAAVLIAAASAPLLARTHPAWMETARREADRYGYKLIGHEDMAALLDQEDLLLIDVRPDYEFDAGHIPGAVNMEFDLADRSQLSQEKREAFKQLAGPDKQRTIVVYCRSFR